MKVFCLINSFEKDKKERKIKMTSMLFATKMYSYLLEKVVVRWRMTGVIKALYAKYGWEGERKRGVGTCPNAR